MKKCHIAVFVSAFFGYSTSCAYADWQFTKWSESLDELLASAPSSIRKTTPKEADDLTVEDLGIPLALGEYDASGIKRLIFFHFSNGKLSGVRLMLNDKQDAMTATRMLTQKYQKPILDEESSSGACKKTEKNWVDISAGNSIRLISDVCGSWENYRIFYTPIADFSQSGL